MITHRALTPFTSTDDVKALFAQPPGEWPNGWAGFPNVQEAFRQMFNSATAQLPAPPAGGFPVERGIVIVSGGWRFFPSLYVAISVIRHVGCKLPIQVWYLGDRGEFDPRMKQALDRFDVGWIDANAFARDHGLPRRILGGWELKPFAAAYCPFREVIYLDADSYPVYNPETFMATDEYQRVGAAFWPDQGKLEPGQWATFGLPHHDEPAWETGQFIIDKARHWAPLALTIWLNDHSDYVYQHVYGDKDTFHLAWRKLGHEACMPTREPGWEQIAFLQKDFAGNPLFIHRTRDKFRWTGEMDGMGVPRHYMTEQWHPTNQFFPGLPHEQFCHDALRESDELQRPHLHFAFRPDTWDLTIWQPVVLGNEYRLPPCFEPTDVIVDVGGHIGAFAHACLMRGAGKIITCEPHPENLELLRRNLARYGNRVEIIPAAVWPKGEPAMMSPAEDNPHNTGGGTVCRGRGQQVDTITLVDVLARAGGLVRLLKLDCEGAEYAILDGVDLSRVQNVCGEAHDIEIHGRRRSVNDVIATLPSHPAVDRYKNGPTTWLFYASRAAG